MYYYAELDKNGICVSVATLAGEVNKKNLISIASADEDKIYRKYENGQWSVEKFEPQSTAPLTEFEKLKAENNLLGQQVVNLELTNMELKQQNNTLGQQLVDMDLRLLNLETRSVV